MNKYLKVLFLSIFSFICLPLASLADGEDKTNTVETIADNGDVTQNVGNIKVTTDSGFYSAVGIFAEARNGYTATVNANNIDVNATTEDTWYQNGIEASSTTSGKIYITTKKITSKDQGILATADGQGSEVSITTDGDIQGGIYSDGHHNFIGVLALGTEDGKTTIVVNGNVSNRFLGLHVRGCGNNNKGKVNVTVNGDVTASNLNEGKGIKFLGTSDTADVLVTGTITGGKYGVNTSIYDTDIYHPELGANKLTVWKISAPSVDDIVVKQTDFNKFETDKYYAKKINYIVKHDANVAPKKADGTPLDTSHGYPVAREGDKVIVATALLGVKVARAFNNGIEIKDVDTNGSFYVVVPRGGGINLSIETAPVVPDLDTDGDGVPDNIDVCPNDPLNSLEMPVGGCFVDGSNIPERYDPKVATEVIATPKTKPLPAYVLHNGGTVNVYFERFKGGAFKADDKKLGKTKYEVMIKTKNKKGLTKKTVLQALSKNSRKFKLGKGVTITVQYRMVITKKVGKKNVTKRSKWSKAVKFQKINLN